LQALVVIRRMWLGAAITTGFLVLLLSRIPFGEMGEALNGANYLYIVPGVGIYFLSLYARAFRWRFLLKPFISVRTNRLFPVVVVGYMANNVLPIRLGELARGYYLSTREPVKGSTALATIVIERVFDGLTLLLFLVVGALFLPVSGLAERVSDSAGLPTAAVVLIVILPFVSVFTLMIIAALYPRIFLTVTTWAAKKLPDRYEAPVFKLIERFLAGFEGLHKPSRLATVFLLSWPVWIIEGIVYYVVALGFDIQSELDGVLLMVAAMLVLTSISNLATAIPSSQGSVGPFEFFAWLALDFVNVSSGVASAYALVLHAALLLPVIAVGFLYLASQGIGLGELTGSRRSGVSERTADELP
jgi:uncharacterized protein (TIRG00374 family)